MVVNDLFVCTVCFSLCFLTTVKSLEVLPEFQSHPNWKLVDRGEDCGHSSSNRIIGGVQASLGQYPWVARFAYTFDEEADSLEEQIVYDCGGAVISERYILTAAHCGPAVMRLPFAHVRLGEHDMKADIDCVDGVCALPVQDIGVEETICHPHYTNVTYEHDICLVRLAAPIQFNRYVYPICLPAYGYFQSNDHSGQIMEVAGWGATNTKTWDDSDVLLTLKVPVVNHNSCVKNYIEMVDITEKQLCAGGVIGQDSCRGDSGGPLMSAVSLDAPPRFFVVGVVSFGPTMCAESHSPGVYTNVFHYMKWILDTIKE